MKLTVDKSALPSDLYQKSHFDEFLRLFDLDGSFLPEKILTPLDTKAARTHFSKLSRLQKQIQNGHLDLPKIVNRIKRLPYVNSMPYYFEKKCLEQDHLFILGNFIAEELYLTELETAYPIASAKPLCKIKTLLMRYMHKNCSRMRTGPFKHQRYKAILDLQAAISHSVRCFESKVYQETGIKFVYPFPRHIRQAEIMGFKNLEQFPYVSLIQKNRILELQLTLPQSIIQMIKEKHRQLEIFTKMMRRQLSLINTALHPFHAVFKNYCEKRNERVYQYALLWAVFKHNLVIPKIKKECGCLFEHAFLPEKTSASKNTPPIDIKLEKGATILFDTNISAKTATMKNLFFQLTAIQMGLPVPAKKASLHFPQHIYYHPATCGRLSSSSSRFYADILFLSRPKPKHAYILLEELFQSTDPVCGAELSLLFLDYFNHKKQVVFLATHYTQVAAENLFPIYKTQNMPTSADRLPDIIPENQTASLKPLCKPKSAKKQALSLIRNQLRQAPLMMALHYPLDDKLLQSIQRKLAEWLPVDSPKLIKRLPAADINNDCFRYNFEKRNRSRVHQSRKI